MIKKNLKYCSNCQETIYSNQLAYYDKYFGGNAFCSKQCMMENLFEELSGGYEATLNDKEIEKVYEVELIQDYSKNETIFALYEYHTVTNSHKLIHEDTLSMDPDDLNPLNMNTISTFFYCWDEDCNQTDFNGDYISDFSQLLLTLNPDLIVTDNEDGKLFKESLIIYQQQNPRE